jgi:hypothetical protein
VGVNALGDRLIAVHCRGFRVCNVIRFPTLAHKIPERIPPLLDAVQQAQQTLFSNVHCITPCHNRLEQAHCDVKSIELRVKLAGNHVPTLAWLKYQ